MRTRIDPVTARYTEAFFRLARERGALDDVRRDVGALARAVGDPERRSMLDARVALEERRRQAESVTADMHPLTRRFVGLLFEKRREDVLRSLDYAFRQRLLEERNAVEGVVETARPLRAEEVANLARAVGRRLGKDVTLENRVAPDLVGGARVLVGSTMIDHSVQGRLDDLKRRMLATPLPTQET